jgi:hypothetical protein
VVPCAQVGGGQEGGDLGFSVSDGAGFFGQPKVLTESRYRLLAVVVEEMGHAEEMTTDCPKEPRKVGTLGDLSAGAGVGPVTRVE